MDKALGFEPRDCGFESRHDLIHFLSPPYWVINTEEFEPFSLFLEHFIISLNILFTIHIVLIIREKVI